MPTILTHAVVGAALAQVGPRSVPRGRLTLALAALAMLPDLDVVAFRFGIPYSHWLGHRGLSHSVLFGVCIAAIVARLGFRRTRVGPHDRWWLFGLCSAAIVSHGVLDACTNGGLGIAFFLPFTTSRYFLPFRPLDVSPIGIESFLRGPAFAVFASEILYVWLPIVVLLAWVRVSSRRSRSVR
jgi:inner membrane protein